THLAAYLLGAGSRDPRLEDLAREFLGMQLMGSDQLLGTGRNIRPAVQCEPADCAQYSGPRAQAILYLRPRLSAEMRNLGVDYLFQEVELPLSRVLAAMEQEGVAVDVPYLRDMQEELQEQLKALEEEVAQVSGYSNPNLTNIPIRTELGQRIRRAFAAGRPDHVLFAADYSQIELRIAAHLSEDPEMLAAFAAGLDIHTATAAKVFKVPVDQVDPNQRRLAKVANFGSIYGQGEYGLSQQLRIAGDEARAFLKEYWTTYARLQDWLDSVRAQARETGVVINALGRRRAIPDLRSPNYQLRAAAERMAINFPIQSLQADIIKIAMVRLSQELEQAGLAGRMLLQVH